MPSGHQSALLKEAHTSGAFDNLHLQKQHRQRSIDHTLFDYSAVKLCAGGL